MASLPYSDALIHLREALPDSYFCFPGSREYDRENSYYHSAVHRCFRPICIFLPSTTEEISTFVREIKPYALRDEIRFAIAGNGRQMFLGCNNIKSGITVNLSCLKGIEIDEDANIVRIAAGECWGRVYDSLEHKALEVAGGISDKSGVAGQALQGRFICATGRSSIDANRKQAALPFFTPTMVSYVIM